LIYRINVGDIVLPPDDEIEYVVTNVMFLGAPVNKVILEVSRLDPSEYDDSC